MTKDTKIALLLGLIAAGGVIYWMSTKSKSVQAATSKGSPKPATSPAPVKVAWHEPCAAGYVEGPLDVTTVPPSKHCIPQGVGA
jgi:hypothetical protein